MRETNLHSIVLYETKNVPCVELIDLAFDYFEMHGIFIYEAFVIKWNDQESDLNTIPTNRKDLKELINKQNFDFSISGDLENNNCYFSYSTKTISGVNNVMMGICNHLINDSFTKKIENGIVEKSQCIYGYEYVEYSWSKAILYANDNFLTPYDYEIPGKWQNFMRFNKSEMGKVMRLVYHQNFISTFFLNREFNGTTLRSWIELSDNNGKLENINKDLCKWTIRHSELYRINKACAENDLLVSFKNLA